MELMISCLKPSIALQMAHCIWGYCSIKQTLLAHLLPTLESFWMCALVSEVKRLPIFHIIPNFLHTPACVRCTWGETEREGDNCRRGCSFTQMAWKLITHDTPTHNTSRDTLHCALLMGKKRNITQRQGEKRKEMWERNFRQTQHAMKNYNKY